INVRRSTFARPVAFVRVQSTWNWASIRVALVTIRAALFGAGAIAVLVNLVMAARQARATRCPGKCSRRWGCLGICQMSAHSPAAIITFAQSRATRRSGVGARTCRESLEAEAHHPKTIPIPRRFVIRRTQRSSPELSELQLGTITLAP